MASMTTQIFRRAANDRGAELIEFAIVFPLLLMVVAGIVDFGFLFQRYEVVTNAAREGARLGALPGYDEDDVRSRIDNYLKSGGLTGWYPLPQVVYDDEVLASGPTVPVVRVVLDYPSRFSFMGPIAGMIGGSSWGTITLRAGSVMRIEGGS